MLADEETVASTYAPQFATMAQGISFAKSLLEAFLTGLAIAAGVSLFIYPVTSRKVVFKEMSSYIEALRGCMKVQTGYLHTLENTNMFSPHSGTHHTSNHTGKNRQPQRPDNKDSNAEIDDEANKLKGTVAGLAALHGKLHGDLSFAKKEVGYGKLKANDLTELFRLFRNVMLPIVGMGTIVDMVKRIVNQRMASEEATGSDNEEHSTVKGKSSTEVEIDQWNEIMKSLHTPFEAMAQTIDEGLLHISYTLEFSKPSRKSKHSRTSIDDPQTSVVEDVEAKGDVIKPGQTGFVQYLERKTDKLHKERQVTLTDWCKSNDIKTASAISDISLQPTPDLDGEAEQRIRDRRNQQQVYLLLYVSPSFFVHKSGSQIQEHCNCCTLRLRSTTYRGIWKGCPACCGALARL